MYYKLFRPRNFKTLKGQLAKKTFGMFGLKVASLGLSFITSIFLSRILGASGYGVYAYSVVWLNILMIPATLGLPELIVREVAVCKTQGSLEVFQGLLLWSNRMVLGVSVVIVFLAAFIAVTIVPHNDSTALIVFLVAILSLPLAALTSIRQSTLQGLHKVVVSQLPEFLIQPFLFLLLLSSTYFFAQVKINPIWVIGFRVATVSIAFTIGSFILIKVLPSDLNKVQPDYQKVTYWLRGILPFMLISSTAIINTRTDAVMLGAIQGTESVGIYTVATRGADLVAITLLAISQSIKPNLASLYASNRHNELQQLVTKSARLTALGSLPIALGFIVFGYQYLSLFGIEFTRGQTALSLLSLGQFMSACIGSVGLLLGMTGHERDTSICVAISAVANIILNWWLIPIWGINGAAFATLVSALLWNLSLSVLVYWRLGISPSAFSSLFSRPHI
jgi:O-antigen/teichoic acid export membrane protein